MNLTIFFGIVAAILAVIGWAFFWLWIGDLVEARTGSGLVAITVTMTGVFGLPMALLFSLIGAV